MWERNALKHQGSMKNMQVADSSYGYHCSWHGEEEEPIDLQGNAYTSKQVWYGTIV
jgi:hypothetical protein